MSGPLSLGAARFHPGAHHFAAPRLSLALAALACAMSAGASQAAPVTQAPRVAEYACANGMTLTATFVTFEGLEAVIVTYPDGRSPDHRVRRLLAASQTASGVRYASDIAYFQMKGRKAWFQTDASALSAAVARTQCVERDTPGRPPLTQGARAGTYWIVPPQEAPSAPPQQPLLKAEAICLAPDGERAIALLPDDVGRAAMIVVLGRGGQSNRKVNVGDVDAGVGQRRFALSDPKSGAMVGSLHFIAPGMVETDALAADAHLSSVTLGQERTQCLALDSMVYAALTPQGFVTISLEETQLVLTIDSGQQNARSYRDGYVHFTADGAAYYFFDGSDYVRVGNSPDDRVIALHDYRDLTVAPLASFAADASALPAGVQQIGDPAVAYIDLLSRCTHLAGEASDDSVRNQELASAAKDAGCASLQARRAALSGQGKPGKGKPDGAFDRFLKATSSVEPGAR